MYCLKENFLEAESKDLVPLAFRYRSAKYPSHFKASPPPSVPNAHFGTIPLLIPRNSARVIRTYHNPGYFIAEKIGDKLLVSLVPIKINFIINRDIVVQNFRRDLSFRTTAHDDFKNPHGPTIIAITIYVQNYSRDVHK